MRFFSAGFRIWGKSGAEVWKSGQVRTSRVVRVWLRHAHGVRSVRTKVHVVPHTTAGGAMPYLEGAHEGLVHTHHGTRVIELAAIVRRRKESHQLPPSEELVPVLHDLQDAVRGARNG